MSSHPFIKVWSAGNDYILFPKWYPSPDELENIPLLQLCHRTQGIGAAGIIFMQLDHDHPKVQIMDHLGRNSFKLPFSPVDGLFYQFYPEEKWLSSWTPFSLFGGKDQKIGGYLTEDQDFIHIFKEDDFGKESRILKEIGRNKPSNVNRIYGMTNLSPEEVKLSSTVSHWDQTALLLKITKNIMEQEWMNTQVSLKTADSAFILSKIKDTLSISAPAGFVFEGSIEV